jgi:uncharacterized Zn finger protein (UPF0148 family)
MTERLTCTSPRRKHRRPCGERLVRLKDSGALLCPVCDAGTLEQAKAAAK